jgi:hypothetical protein
MRSLLLALLFVAGCGGEMPSDLDGSTEDGGTDSDDAGTRRRDGGMSDTDAGRPPEPCETAGAIEDVPCGACGSVRRFCSTDSVWVYGLCEDETGECTPGATRMGTCGSCGRSQQVCSDACVWETIGECTSEGACEPGELIRTSMGCPSGQRDMRCNDSCELEPVSECMADPCTTPGDIEDVDCGNCGTRRRFCTTELEWEYGRCSEEGECAPGSLRDEDCGNCGNQSMACNDQCTWFALGECEQEGECSPGTLTTGTEGCSGDQQRELTCNDACEFEPTSACTSASGERGDACTPGSCMPGLICDDNTEVSICRATCSETVSCPGGDSCFTGDGVCEDTCTPFTHAGCPTGSKCDPLNESFGDVLAICSGIGTGTQGDYCRANWDCARNYVCFLLVEGSPDGECRAICDAAHPCLTGTCNHYDVFGQNLGYCL